MTDEAESVSQDLEAGYSDAARESLSRIVSRDVSELDDSEIASATISSVAENVTDSVVGPLVAYGAFGLPGAAAYRAIDTLDSMIGYRGKYEHLGALPQSSTTRQAMFRPGWQGAQSWRRLRSCRATMGHHPPVP